MNLARNARASNAARRSWIGESWSQHAIHDTDHGRSAGAVKLKNAASRSPSPTSR
jgi:hypothetical protein